MSGRLIEEYLRGEWIGALTRFRGSQVTGMETWNRTSPEEAATMAVHTIHVVPYMDTTLTTVSSLDPNIIDQGTLGYTDPQPYEAGGTPVPLILSPVPAGRAGFPVVGSRGRSYATRGGNPRRDTEATP